MNKILFATLTRGVLIIDAYIDSFSEGSEG